MNNIQLVSSKIVKRESIECAAEVLKDKIKGEQSTLSKDSEWKEISCIEISNDDEFSLDTGDNNETCAYTKQVAEIFRKNYSERAKPKQPLVAYSVGIKLRENKGFNCNPRRLSQFERSELNKIIADYLEQGIIRESDSPYSSKVVLTKKKNDTFRMCVNFRPLNKLIERDHFPLPIIEDQIQQLHGKRYFSSLDLKNGFYHVDIEESSKKYTSFVTEDGQYEFNKLPFGYANSPAAFVRYVYKVLKELTRSGNVIVFVDDILVATDSIEKHLEVLSMLLKTLSDNHVNLQLTKCHFLKSKIEYLGYEIEENKITPSKRHIEAVSNYPVPHDKKSLHRFLGLMGYFRKFILNFSRMAAPFYEMLKENVDFVWRDEHFELFESLKENLISKPVLSIYSPVAETELHTDASASGFGAILLQKQSDGNLHPVMYFSKKTTEAESKLHSYELEALAVVYSLQRFRVYLFGIKFKLVTDCDSLRMTLDKKDINPKISRWALKMDEFDFEVIHRQGTKMQHVDAFSRIHVFAIDCENNLLYDSIYAQQQRDTYVQDIKKRMESGRVEGFEVRDGIVYRKEGGRLLLVVPATMITSILYKFHNSFGHFGVDKSCELIKRSFYFPGLRSKVQNHVNNCVTCIMYNPRPIQKEVPLHLYEKIALPFDTIHIDHLGPLPESKGKCKYVFTIIDSFTKYIKLYPTKTTNTREVLKAIRSYILTYSTPRRLVSDRGSAFTSNSFAEYMKETGIKHVLIATACPQSNGQMERYNRTLVPLLGKLVEESSSDWDSLLSDAEFFLNNTKNSSINTTPSQMLFGIEQKRKIERNILEIAEGVNNEIICRDLEEVRRNGKEQIEKRQLYNKEYYDKSCRKNTKFVEGELVVIRANKVPGENCKINKKYKGPYEVKKVLDRDRYVIGDLKGYQVSNVKFQGIFDASNLKRYLNKDQCSERREESESDVEYEEVEYLDECYHES